MRASSYARAVLFCAFCLILPGFAQQNQGSSPADMHSASAATPQSAAAVNHISLNVVVTDKSGNPVRGLAAKDFQLLDNKQPQKILSLQSANDAPQLTAPTEIILVLDEVNTPYSDTGFEREGISKFLRENGGKLPYPVTFAYFTNRGTTLLGKASTDGNALAAAYEQHETAVRSFNQLGTSYGALEQFQLSFKTLNELIYQEGQKPGRKMMIWFSRGWPLMAVSSVDLDKKQQDALFAAIVSTSNAMREAKVTLYNINPAGQVNGGSTLDYLSFVKPVQQAKHVEVGNLALQVLATQSGGLVLHSSNDIVSEITRCIADASASYALTAEMPASDHADQYHAIEVKPQTPGLVVRTIGGYYAQP